MRSFHLLAGPNGVCVYVVAFGEAKREGDTEDLGSWPKESCLRKLHRHVCGLSCFSLRAVCEGMIYCVWERLHEKQALDAVCSFPARPANMVLFFTCDQGSSGRRMRRGRGVCVCV